MLIFLAEIIFLALLVFLVMTFVHTPNKRKIIVGPVCIVFNILMYFAPLTVMVRACNPNSALLFLFLNIYHRSFVLVCLCRDKSFEPRA